jgi:hypothetical protein
MSAMRDTTLDPRILSETGFGSTPLGLGKYEEIREDSIRRGLDTLTDCVESLTRLPIKWVTQLRDLGEEGYSLVEPVQIVVEEYPDDSVVARLPEAEVFGEGNSEAEALQNLRCAILDLYDDLTEATPDSLGDAPRVWLRVLERIIVKG